MTARDRMRLTDEGISRLRPREREYTVWDTRVAGLGVRIRPSGGASFVVLQTTDGGSKRISLGPVTFKGVDEVRRECYALMASSELQTTTAEPHKSPPFAAFATGPWKEAHFPRYKPSTQRYVRASLDNQLVPAFGSTSLDRITRTQVVRWFNRYSRSAPGGANHTLSLMRQILNYAIACGHIETNPTDGVQRNRRIALTRFLSRDEIRRLHLTLDGHSERNAGAKQQADIIRLLLFTGCRKCEILALRWREVIGGTLVLGDTKTGSRTVHLNVQALRIIERQPRDRSALVFPSLRNSDRPRSPHLALWVSVRREAGIEDVRLHDLRHTFASHSVMSGVPVPVVSRILGHTNVRMTLRYAHLADKQIEAAAERIGAAMARTMALEQAVALPGFRRRSNEGE